LSRWDAITLQAAKHVPTGTEHLGPLIGCRSSAMDA
jgi:hypothetical protein